MNPLDAYIADQKDRFLEDLKGWIRIPSVSTSIEHVGDVYSAAQYAANQMEQVGLNHVEVIRTEGHPLVYGEWLNALGKATLLVYGHYDVQPIDPIAQWNFPPFEPIIQGNNIYGRGASDDKGQTMSILKALETLIAVNGKLPINVRVVLEGEEECGGSSIEQYIRTHPERVQCDTILICDTQMPSDEIPVLTYGLRGILYAEIELRVGQDLHSGIFGGNSANALHMLAILLARLKDANGHIHIPGLYDKLREPTSEEYTFWREDPLQIAASLHERMGGSQFSGEVEYLPLERLWARPTLDVHGIIGGFIDEGAKTVIPGVAKAKISLRLPSDLKSAEVLVLLERAIQEYASPGVEVDVRKLHSGEAVLIPTDSLPMAVAAAALKETYGKEPYYIRDGASIPIVAILSEILQVPIILMGFGLPDDNLHAPNEKYSLKQFFRGIRTIASFLQRLETLSV